MHLFNINPRFRGLKFPSINCALTLKKRYSQILSSDLIEFMEWVLQLEPNKRPTIDDCSGHYAFNEGGHKHGLNSQDSNSSLEEAVEQWPEVELSSSKQLNMPKNDLNSGNMFTHSSNEKSQENKSVFTNKNNFAFHSTNGEPSDEDEECTNNMLTYQSEKTLVSNKPKKKTSLVAKYNNNDKSRVGSIKTFLGATTLSQMNNLISSNYSQQPFKFTSDNRNTSEQTKPEKIENIKVS